MALELQKTLVGTSLLLPAAYCKIRDYNGTKESLSYIVDMYENHQAKLDNKKPLGNPDTFVVRLVDLNIPANPADAVEAFYTAFYNHLKLQDGYVGGIDV